MDADRFAMHVRAHSTIYLSTHVVPGPMGPKKRHKKGSHFIKQCWFLEVSQFPENYLFWGVILKNGFSPKAVQPEAPGVQKNIQGPIWRPKDQFGGIW